MEEKNDIRAIETIYKGFRFRSRLEARWAVFMDALGIQWEYEKEGYDLGAEGWYLPDFWLPQYNAFFELKPNKETVLESRSKFAAISKLYPIVVTYGYPTSRQLFNATSRVFFSARDDESSCFWVYSDHPFFLVLTDDKLYLWNGQATMFYFSRNQVKVEGILDRMICHPKLIAAYDAGRQARFEHGERP